MSVEDERANKSLKHGLATVAVVGAIGLPLAALMSQPPVEHAFVQEHMPYEVVALETEHPVPRLGRLPEGHALYIWRSPQEGSTGIQALIAPRNDGMKSFGGAANNYVYGDGQGPYYCSADALNSFTRPCGMPGGDLESFFRILYDIADRES